MKTYIGLIVAFAPTLLSWFGVTPTPAFNEEFPNMAAQFVELAGLLFAFYGRAVATAPGWFAKTSQN